MTNRFPGKCCVCQTDVAIGAGTLERDRLGYQVKHLTCPEKKPVFVYPKAFMMPNRMDEFVALVSEMKEPSELNHVRKILNTIKASGGKHPLYDAKFGFGRLYEVLNAKAGELGFGQYNSDRMYYRPIGLVATKPL